MELQLDNYFLLTDELLGCDGVPVLSRGEQRFVPTDRIRIRPGGPFVTAVEAVRQMTAEKDLTPIQKGLVRRFGDLGPLDLRCGNPFRKV